MDEYITKEQAIESVRPYGCTDKGIPYYRFVSNIRKMKVADVAPVVHGRWMPVYESQMTGWDPAVAGRDPIGGYICSVCKEETVYDCNDNFVLSNYCPNCGARMDIENRGDNDEAD